MGNEVSSRKGRSDDEYSDDDTAGDGSIVNNRRRRRGDENASSFLIDNVCGNFAFFNQSSPSKSRRKKGNDSFGTYSDDESDNDEEEEEDEDDDTLNSMEDRKKERRRGRSRSRRNRRPNDDDTLDNDDDDDTLQEQSDRAKERDNASVTSSLVSGSDVQGSLLSKPLASSFAKKCYFTKSGIGKKTQHYEGLTLTGNTVLMLPLAMNLKGCPTICDEDLRRVEQTYPNQFSRLPDELLLSSGWRRISKFCYFSNKPIPDGVAFFHSKERLHPQGGYYFLLASSVGMVRPCDVDFLTRDNLVVLETDYSTQCDSAPKELINDPSQWILVEKFCFFSGGPINTEEDVYYVANFDGNAIFMLAFLSPSLTPEELYRLGSNGEVDPDNFLKSSVEVEEVESVYDLTDRDFDDLKLYHLGPCRALPHYILQPDAWTKILPPHFITAKQKAMDMARKLEGLPPEPVTQPGMDYDHYNNQWSQMPGGADPYHDGMYNNGSGPAGMAMQMQGAVGGYPVADDPTVTDYYSINQGGYDQSVMGTESHQPMYQDQAQYHNQMLHQQQMHDTSLGAGGQEIPYQQNQVYDPEAGVLGGGMYQQNIHPNNMEPTTMTQFQREAQEEGAFVSGMDAQPMDEAIAARAQQEQQQSQIQPPPLTTPQKQSHGDLSSSLGAPQGSPTSDSSYYHNRNTTNTEGTGVDAYNTPTKPKNEEKDKTPNRMQENDESGSGDNKSTGDYVSDTFSDNFSSLVGRRSPSFDEAENYNTPSPKNNKKSKDSPRYLNRQSAPDPSIDDEDFMMGRNSKGRSSSPSPSGAPSAYSSHATSNVSHAMRGAQELLRRNRQKRQKNKRGNLEPLSSQSGEDSLLKYSPQSMSSDNDSPYKSTSKMNLMKDPEPEPTFSMSEDKGFDSPEDYTVPEDEVDEDEFDIPENPTNDDNFEDDDDIGDDFTDASGSVISGSYVSGSSIWTDTSMNDRGTRRALILQMAKARMRNGSSTNNTKSDLRNNYRQRNMSGGNAVENDIIHEDHYEDEEEEEDDELMSESDFRVESNNDLDLAPELD